MTSNNIALTPQATLLHGFPGFPPSLPRLGPLFPAPTCQPVRQALGRWVHQGCLALKDLLRTWERQPEDLRARRLPGAQQGSLWALSTHWSCQAADSRAVRQQLGYS